MLSGPSQHVPPEPVCRVPEELGPVPAAAGDGAEVHSQPAAGPVPAGAPATDTQSPHVRSACQKMEWVVTYGFVHEFLNNRVNKYEPTACFFWHLLSWKTHQASHNLLGNLVIVF